MNSSTFANVKHSTPKQYRPPPPNSPNMSLIENAHESNTKMEWESLTAAIAENSKQSKSKN